MNTAAEFRVFVDECRRMALATNDPEWNSLAERWQRCAESIERQVVATGNRHDENRKGRKQSALCAA